MEKSCLTCFFKYPGGCTWSERSFGKEICDKYIRECCKCHKSQADYKFKGQYYCIDCVLSFFDIEEERTTKYYLKDRYLGDDNNIEKVIDNLNEDIRKIKGEEKYNE
ncbi:hypothetical protein [Clostridium perfringens]|uniref:hypothetical protein n=1 Tax=Clostridium perfringens TaxID=1502 RepID=UPI0018E46016|nr:hypothetical protein [Clostridium perfringens]MBI6052334.1 hypothetical protein [Clostridium perfringens]